MDSHIDSEQVRRLEVVETGRRRRWTEEEKVRIVAESASAPRAVSATARQHGISPSQLFGWRRAFGITGATNEGRTAAPFLPVSIGSDGEPASGQRPRASAKPVRVEIELAGGRIVRTDAAIDPEALSRILEVVDRRR